MLIYNTLNEFYQILTLKKNYASLKNNFTLKIFICVKYSFAGCFSEKIVQKMINTVE